MRIFYEKQTRNFFMFIGGVLLLGLFLLCLIFHQQAEQTKALIIDHDTSIASYLLEEGIDAKLVAKALCFESASEEAQQFMGQIGRTKTMDTYFLLPVRTYQERLVVQIGFAWIGIASLMLIGSFYFFKKRNRLYEQAIEIVKAFTKGDFSVHLPSFRTGDLYYLFGLVEELAKALQAKNEMTQKAKLFLQDTISDISHQLKTPLAALRMYNEIIMDEPEVRETVITFSEKANASLERMEQLIGMLLKMTRLDTDNIQFEKNAYLVGELVEAALTDLKVRAVKEDKVIIVRGEDINLYCDKQWTSEAISNLVKNALDHTRPGGKITVCWEHFKAITRLSVTDDGEGIAEEDLHHVFKRFYRSSKAVDTNGIGLGLPLAKTIIEKQGGVIAVQSHIHEGSTFTISFPADM